MDFEAYLAQLNIYVRHHWMKHTEPVSLPSDTSTVWGEFIIIYHFSQYLPPKCPKRFKREVSKSQVINPVGGNKLLLLQF